MAKKHFGWRLSAIAALVAVAALALAACGSSSGGDTTSSGANATTASESETGGSSSSIVATAEKEVSAAEEISTSWPGPTEPVKPPTGSKTVGIIPCGPYGGCLLDGKGVEQAADALGWKSTTVTPVEGTPQEVNSIFLRLIDRNVDAIIWVGFPRVILKQAITAAQEHEVPMISIEAAEVTPEDISLGNPKQPMQALGEQVAWWTIADSEGKAKIGLLSDDEFITGTAIDEGFERVLSKCDECSIVDRTDIQAAEEEEVAPSETITMLQRNPDIEYLFAPFDSRVPFMVQGAREAQRPDVKVLAGEAEKTTLESIASSTEPRVYAATNSSRYWTGWAAMDQLLRKLAGQPLIDHPIPIVLRTATNISAETYKPISKTDAIDFSGEFKKLWGLGN